MPLQTPALSAEEIAAVNQRLVACARTGAEAYRGRHAVISRDPRYAEEAAQLLADARRLDAMADRWESNFPARQPKS